MAIIKNLAFYQKSALKNLTEFVGNSKFSANFLPFPLDFFNHILPLRMKFYQEAFVALENDEIAGLVALEKERGNFKKLKITKLYLKENSKNTGEQLINYVVSRYLAYGATSFQVVVQEEFEELVNLFANLCNFRISSTQYLYKIPQNILKKDFCPPCFKNYENSMADTICKLNNESICQHLAPCFEKNPKYFAQRLANGANATFKYIFYDEEHGRILGYFSIMTLDNLNYLLDIVISPAYDSYFIDICRFSYQQIKKRNQKGNLYVRIKNYFMNSKELIKQAENAGFEPENKNLILTKDYLTPVNEKIKYTNKILFQDASTPAFNGKFQ